MSKIIKKGEELEHDRDLDHGVEGFQPFVDILH
jgi:hypothetical protein